MGGKTKLARVKNNAKPSSSSRSAQLLGNSVSAFVGFSAHSEHGVIPFAPGFSDIGTDSGSLNVDPQLQLILRKMIKKDPVTKVKALREFKELLDSYDLDAVKNVLPLWPKLYHNLSNDVDHRVRQSAQEVMNAFAVKCKKSIAPCLKQLVPTWIASSFDDYAPAASIARLSFNSTFPSVTNKVREVCLFCQNEILEYVARNLTHHTVSTFSTKHCIPEDADQKYQRIVYCSLKTLSFFLEVTNCAENIKIEQCLQDMLNNSKFWSFSKSKDRKVKASWFEVLLNVLQSEWSANVVTALKSQIIATCFQNIEECEPLVASNVWSCIMLVQLKFEDWYKVINFDKAVMPKLSALLRKGFNKNVDAICPNLLPFLSKISPEVLKDGNISDFRKRFFDDIKEALTTAENITKAEYSAITASYFECLRFVMKQINITWQEKSEDERSPLKLEANQLLRENIIDLLIWCLTKEGPVVKFIMQHVSTLITFWADPVRDSNLYVEMVDTFWSSINSFIIADLVNKKDDEIFLNRVIELIEKLYFGNPKMEDQKVKFDLKEASAIEEAILKKSTNFELCKKERSIRQVSLSAANEQQAENLLRRPSSKAYIESDLRNLVIQLIRLCLEKSNNELGSNYILKARKVFNLFNDADFYAQVSEEKTIRGTLNMFLGIMEHLESTACENVIDMIFEVLTYLPKCEKIDFIEKNLLKVPQLHVQHLVINRLLSYPLISEPEVRAIISNPKASNIIKDFAQHVLTDNCKESLIILRKCFFQNDAGEIPIDQKTVEEIIRSLSQPLAANTGMDGQAELCASFIAQIMPVVCGEGNTSLELQRHIFLKLFRFSIEHLFDDGISEDTLWETSTCWQDALSSQDIIADMQLLRECKAIVQNYLQKNNLTTEVIEELATAVTQLAICSTEHITDEKERLLQLDITIKELCRTETNRTLEQTYKLCLFLEALLGKVYLDKKLTDDCMEDFEKLVTFRQILLNACIIYKIVCKSPKIRAVTEYDSEGNEISQACSVLKDRDVNQWSATLYDEAFQCISMASIADSLRNSIPKMESALEMVLIQLSEKAKLILANGCDDFISQLKSYMLEKAIKDEDISVVRALLYLVHANQYSQFEENATILLFEDLSEYLLTRNSLKVYVSALQLFLPHLCSNIITTQNPIMQTKLTGISIRAAVLRCLVQNNFSCDYNAMSDRDIIGQTINFLLEISQINHVNKEAFLYNVEIHKQSFENVVDIVEFIELLKEVITKFPYELTIKNWDAIQIGLSLWVLSVSKSIEQLKNPQVALVTAKVFELYATLTNFISNEKQKSSTEFLTNIFDEWENLFARDVNLVLFKTYYNLVEHQGLVFKYSTCYEMLLQVITPAMDHINYEVVYKFHKSSKQISIENVLTFLLKNLSNKVHCIRTMSLKILKKMAQYYIATDFAAYENKIESINFNSDAGDWHFLKIMEEYIERYGTNVYKYLPEFSFKLSEIAELKSVDQDECLPYLFLWDCIIYVCANSPITLRSLYTNWLHEKLYEENFLHFLFRAMPTEILKNYDSKLFSSEAFKGLTWRQIQDPTLPVEKYVCHLYTEVLRKLPAVVRRWWNVCHSRQKTYVDKLTTNFVSPIICNEELKALSNKRDKHDNMQVTVHTSTREVLAVYFIDEARMELIIKLTQNYPLGSVKVEIGKQIGGRLSSRNTGMQLTIFLTHQNGSILDGLALWKKNLDKKFEGVEECYVCYTVIHQDTCQLPKLTCKTCKKKFHGPCLYKWFTTSSKSTCPICRNVF